MVKIAVIEPIIAFFVEIDLVALIIAGLFIVELYFFLGWREAVLKD